MRVLGQRPDGAYALDIGGMGVVLHGDRVSSPLDLSDLTALGPWMARAVSDDEWRTVTQRLTHARQVPLLQLANPIGINQWGGPEDWGKALGHQPTPGHKVEPRDDVALAHQQAGGRVTVNAQGTPRPIPIKVKSVEEAVSHLLAGKVVEVEDVRAVSTLIDKLGTLALDAKAKGDKAPDIDLCGVTVKGASFFCHEAIRNATYPDGIPRFQMPQFSGQPQPGSPADALPKNAKGNADGAPAFMAHLKAKGFATTTDVVPAKTLKASQRELEGAHVAAMVANRGFNPGKEPIFVSRDAFVVDGHHRWAAQVARDLEDGTLGDHEMHVVRIDAPITEILPMAMKWQQEFGFTSKGAKPEGATAGGASKTMTDRASAMRAALASRNTVEGVKERQRLDRLGHMRAQQKLVKGIREHK